MLKKGKTILAAQEGILKGALKEMGHLNENLKTFGESKTTYMCMLFNKNSPLVPLFTKAAIETFERGQYDYASKEWIGRDITYTKKVQADVIGPGQVLLVFIILLTIWVSSLACLIFECMYFYVMKKRLLSKTPPQAIPPMQSNPSREMAPVDSNG